MRFIFHKERIIKNKRFLDRKRNNRNNVILLFKEISNKINKKELDE